MNCAPLQSYPNFRNAIPNGYKVPNPCKAGEAWDGVGHQNPLGSGARNPFGKDWEFIKDWSGVCQLDSDGDGRTNGEELGDPNCQWTGSQPVQFNNVTHPGVCEPLDSAQCLKQNAWLKCNASEKCDSIKSSDVRSYSIHFHDEPVPAQETSYVCKIYDFPSDNTYDIIAAKPIIDRSLVLHHMVLYGCDDPRVNSSRERFDCFMTEGTGCRSMISAFARWDADVNSFCLPPNVGVRAGAGGYTKLMIQYHWTNFDLTEGLTDSSGLKLFYTTRLRKNTAGMLLVGQTYLEIPPRTPRISFSGGCASDCTSRRIRNSVKVIEIFHHMHYLGVEQSVEVFRNGTKIRQLSHQLHYDYNTPVFYRFEDPVELLPGDYIQTTCTFNSMSQNSTVFFGEGSANEMCFAFLRFYPLPNLPLREGGCSEWKSLPLCKIYTGKEYIINGCNPKHFLSPGNSNRIRMFKQVEQNCRAFHRCLPECRELTARIASHPCLNSDIGDFIKLQLGKSYDGAIFLVRLDSCRKVNKTPRKNDDIDADDDVEEERKGGTSNDKRKERKRCEAVARSQKGHAPSLTWSRLPVFVTMVVPWLSLKC